ncbi:NapC/NirT family cytochrome c [Vibrio breoganii]|uniref:NapC/NirT family cytochrome c n=1 Tax=Vibrio breoganii TaxID=553239 RepID=UPI0004748A9C|nr:NapC/NirT family cytochrome c [Vibrio breoganii]
MIMKKRYIALIALIGVGIGWLSLGGTAAILHYTSSTEFCVSCHTMEKPLLEYQGSVHFSNQKGIRAECADCHIPEEPLDYLITKIRASKDIYHEFVTGKIDTDEKYEQHRLGMAEMVWEQMRENDSATCRSCHSWEAMETYDQSASAQDMHAYAQTSGETCIDCHKGVAHFPPQMELDTSEFDHLFDLAKNTQPNAENVYPIERIQMGELATINPTVKLATVESDGDKRTVKVSGYQMKGAETVIYMGEGQRAILATLTEQGIEALKLGEPKTDAYGNEWRTAELTGSIEDPVLDSAEPLWAYAEQLDNVYCATCHAKIAPHHFTVNSWGPVAKSMGDRTDITELNLEILTKFFQNHAKDVANHE